MGIVREYTGDFTDEQEYINNLSDGIDEEMLAIKEIINNIQGDNTWNSIGANDTIEYFNEKLERMNSNKEKLIKNANDILTGLDDLLSVYEK